MVLSAGAGVVEIVRFDVGSDSKWMSGSVTTLGMSVALEGRLLVSALVPALRRTQVPRLRQVTRLVFVENKI